MRLFKRAFVILFSSCLFVIMLNNTGCTKDYSYERQPQDSVVIPDPVIITPPFLPVCSSCKSVNVLADSTWLFKVDNSVLCGFADKALIAPERTAFTFFGVSACSVDTGFMASVYLNEPLNGDKTNLSAAKVAFYYYDGVKPSYILISRQSDAFSLTIDTYIHQTGEAVGRFSGYAYTENGLRIFIEGGKFRVRFF